MRCPSCGREIGVSADARFCPMCGATLASAAEVDDDPWIGRTIAGRFKITRQLGEGGIGRVYVAEQAVGNAKRELAVKMLLPEHASNPEMVKRFFRECEVVSLVEHPNVVRIYDFGEADGRSFYIAMELVAGRSLAAVLRAEGPFPPERAVHVLSQACRAVAAVHDRGVIHRDLKPDNLMLSATADDPDFVKVLDFGIAKSVAVAVGAPATGAPQVTRAGVVLGSPPYMSPEQFLGDDVDLRTDVYALGVVAFEMTTGALPFEATSMHEWATQHLTAAPRAFDDTPAGGAVPHAMRTAILHALAKRPEDRPSTARDLLSELTKTHAPRAVAPTLVETAPQAPDPGAGVAEDARVDVPRKRSPRFAFAFALAAAAAGAATAIAGVALLGKNDRPFERTNEADARTQDDGSSSADGAASDAADSADSADAGDVATVTPPPIDVSGCQRALRATTCEEATIAQKTCPDAARALHHEAHEHVTRLCREHGH